MIIFTPIFEVEQKEKPLVPKYDGFKMSFEDFLNSKLEDQGFKYEWNNGIIEAEERLKTQEIKIYINLHDKFIQNSELIKNYQMISEVESHLTSQKKVRIPDISIFLKKDIQKYKVGEPFIPIVAIEIISPSNQAEELESKIVEYFKEGVALVWCIYPKLQQVKIYDSPKYTRTCVDEDICDMGSSIPSFKISVREIFNGIHLAE